MRPSGGSGGWGGGCNPYICLGLTKSNYLILDVQKKRGMSGEELFIRSWPCALKLKLKYKERALQRQAHRC